MATRILRQVLCMWCAIDCRVRSEINHFRTFKLANKLGIAKIRFGGQQIVPKLKEARNNTYLMLTD
jgi:hypothetical protein